MLKRFVNGREYEIPHDASASVSRHQDRLIVHTPEGTYTALAVQVGDTVLVSYQGRQYTVDKVSTQARLARGATNNELHAPMPGQIVEVLTKRGAKVKQGDRLVVLEAMKTQQPFFAPFDGTVEAAPIKPGQKVKEGDLLIRVRPSGSPA